MLRMAKYLHFTYRYSIMQTQPNLINVMNTTFDHTLELDLVKIHLL